MNAIPTSLRPSPPLAAPEPWPSPAPAAPSEVLSPAGVSALGHLVEEWRELVVRTDGSYFQTPDWVLSWWKDRNCPDAEIAIWRSASGALEAVASLTKVSERFHHRLPVTVQIATNLGSGRPHQADRCGWPVLAHRAVDVQQWLASHRWGKSLLLRHLDPEVARRMVPEGARLVWTTRCPRFNIPPNPGQIGSRHLRARLRQLKRKSDAAGVSFRWIGPEQITAKEIDTLFELHAKRRTVTRQERPSSFLESHSAAFHRKLVDWAGPGRGPAMALAERDGVAVAAWHGFLWYHTFSLYQAGWEPEFAKLCIGTLLLAETIRFAALNNVRVFDFLRGSEDYKYRFGATDALDETWLLPRHISGLLLREKFRTLGKLAA